MSQLRVRSSGCPRIIAARAALAIVLAPPGCDGGASDASAGTMGAGGGATGTGAGGETTGVGGEMPVCAPPLKSDKNGSLGKVIELTAGADDTCAILEDGSTRCWGDNAHKQIGDGSAVDAYYPTEVRSLPPVQRIAPGSDHMCALSVDGCVWCWGDGSHGQMGTGHIDSSSFPGLVPGVSGVVDLSSFHLSSVALTTSGDVLRWGTNGSDLASAKPIPWVPGNSYVTVRTGWGYACGLRHDGVVECWGRNDHGQLGQGDKVDRTVAVAVTGLSDVTMIVTGATSVCAVTQSDSVWCWGGNDAGQIGNGTTEDQLVAQKVAIEQVSQVSMYGSHVCALTAAGELSCWGRNVFQQVNPIKKDAVRMPMSVPSISGLRAVAAAYNSTCALKGDHDIYCWGYNGYGQLGNGKTGFGNAAPTLVVWDPPSP